MQGELISLSEAKSQVLQFPGASYLSDLEDSLEALPVEMEGIAVLACELEGLAD